MQPRGVSLCAACLSSVTSPSELIPAHDRSSTNAAGYLLQELASRLRSLCRFLSNYADRKKEQRRKAKAKPISYFGHASLGQGFGQVDSRGRPNPAAKRQRVDDPVNQEEDRYLCY